MYTWDLDTLIRSTLAEAELTVVQAANFTQEIDDENPTIRTSLRTAPFLSLLFFFAFEEKSAGIGKSVGLAEEEEEGGEEKYPTLTRTSHG